MRSLLIAVFAVLTGAGSALAQGGVIIYDHEVRYDFEIPEQMRNRVELPSGKYVAWQLQFDATGSLMEPVPVEEEEEGDGREARFGQFLKRFSPSRRDQEDLVSTYVSFGGEPPIETTEFMGRTFRIEGGRPLTWSLAAEQKEFMGYMVQKATAVQDSSEIEAWFTPQIPIPSGPGQYHGLPGMVLIVSVDRGMELYSAREISLEASGEPIEVPDDGQEVSREEYEAIVVEKLKEVEEEAARMQNRFRRRGPGGDKQ